MENMEDIENLDELVAQIELERKEFFDWAHTHSDMCGKDKDGYIVVSKDAPERMKMIAIKINAGNRTMYNRLKELKESGTDFGGIIII